MSEAEQEWDRKVFLDLAERFGISDLNALIHEVTSAYHFAGFGLFSATFGDLSMIPVQLRDSVRSDDTQLLLRLSRIQGEMVMALASSENHPIRQTESAAELRRALGLFGRDLMNAVSAPMMGGKERRKVQTRLALALGPAWERLTGERPTAFSRDDGGEKGGGRFYHFVRAVCDIYEIDYPSVEAIREAYSPRAPRTKGPAS